MTPLQDTAEGKDFPSMAIDKRKLTGNTVRSRSDMAPRSGQKEKVARPVSQALIAAQKKEEEKHRKHKEDAKRLWQRLDNPVFDSPLNPEASFPEEAIAIAKRGRQSTLETSVCVRK